MSLLGLLVLAAALEPPRILAVRLEGTEKGAVLRVLATGPIQGVGIERTDPVLVVSVVAEESAFNPLAVSRAGARGLLQVMLATGSEIARRIGLTGYTPDKLFDPETNLTIGSAHLKSLVERLGSVPGALAAYNVRPIEFIISMTA